MLDAAKRCSERWGMAKVTIDDIAAEAGVSRATIYRMFPGGKDVLFDALRVRETEEFLVGLRDHVADATTLEELLVRTVVHATRELRADEHFAVMLASEPGEIAADLTVEGLPRIIRIASLFLCPLVEAVPAPRPRPPVSSSCCPAWSSATSSPRASTSTSATPTPPGASCAPTSSPPSRPHSGADPP